MKLGHVTLNELDKRNWVNIGLTFLTYFCGMAAYFYFEHHLYKLEMIIEKYHVDEVMAEYSVSGISYAIVSLIMAILFALINWKLLKTQYHALKHHFKEYIIWSLIGVVLVFGIQYINGIYFHGPHHAYTSISNQLAGVFSPLTIMSMVLCVAFCEEMVYKVVCYLPIDALSPIQSGIISALLYGILNAAIFAIFLPSVTIGAFLLYTCLGLKFALLYSRTHTIYTSITAGAIYSLISVALSLMAVVH